MITIGESRFNLHTARAEDQAATLTQAKLDETTYRIKKQATNSVLKTNTFMMLPLGLFWEKGGVDTSPTRHQLAAATATYMSGSSVLEGEI